MGYDLTRGHPDDIDPKGITIVNGEFVGPAYEKGLLFRFNNAAWPRALFLADMHGWAPEGTHAPRFDANGDIAGEEYERHDLDWRQSLTLEDSYLTNAYAVVTADDAKSLADSLERALPRLPEEDRAPVDTEGKARADQLMQEAVESGDSNAWAVADLASVLTRRIPLDTVPPDELPFVYFSGPRKRKIEEFITFCRQGEFQIG